MTKQLYDQFYQLAQQILTRLSSTHKGIIGAYIGGSFATKKLRSDSDLDLNIVSDVEDYQRFFEYHNNVPLDLNIYPESWFAKAHIQNIEPPIAIELYHSMLLNDSTGILKNAKGYLQSNLFTTKHQGAWVKSYLGGSRRQLIEAKKAIASKDWTNTQVALHNATMRLGLAVGYLAKTPPNPVTNLPRISEAVTILGDRNIYEFSKQVYTLPPNVKRQEINTLRRVVTKIHATAVDAIVACGKGEEEKRDANQLSPVRPSRWEFLERKLDKLSEGSMEYAFSGIVWAACDLVYLAHKRIPEEMEAYDRLKRYLSQILSISGLNTEVAIQRVNDLSDALDRIEEMTKTEFHII